MKKSAILDIFNGFRGHRDTLNIPKEIIKQYKDKASDIYPELRKKLSPELFDLHQKYVDALMNISGEEIECYFIEGFKLGLLIGIECTEN